MRVGTVYIVGTGPGDPSLISVRGRRYLAAADVVVYDHLVHPRLLSVAPATAERIDVGSAAPQALAQDAINLLLAEKARERRIVVRLKWGDPFVFDSGGKEALFLHEQRIPFEVVPGATAPVAWPSYAGIPVTYPGAGDTLVFIRGFEDGGQKPPKVDWASVAALGGTVVCYAGARQMAGVLEALLAHGVDPEESAAVVLHGTLPRQQTVQRPLRELALALKREPLKAPGILIVGPAVGLREHLRWFDERPLFGRRIIVTRSREQAPDLFDQLEDLGAEAIEAPSSRIAPAADPTGLDEACATAGGYDWLVFTTASSVDAFLGHLLEGPNDVRAMAGPRICTIGPAAADRLARVGLKADLTPVEFGVDAILDAMNGVRPLRGARILLPRAEGAREPIADDLRRAGGKVTEVGAYRAVASSVHADPEYDIYKMLLEGQIDTVMFTSATAVRGFAGMLGEDQAADLLRQTTVACIGPVTAEAAQRLGIHASVVPDTYTVGALVQAIVDHYATAEPATVGR